MSAVNPVLFTSVPPVQNEAGDTAQAGEDDQRACIESWVASGFRVVSVNPASEVDAVRNLRLPLEVAASEDDKLPTIASLLKLAQSTGARLCGIVNADCKMVGAPGLGERLTREATHGLYYGERIDIGDDGEALPGNCGGFDAFFFLPSEIGTDFDATLRLGDPWWDYWFPCVAALRGIELFRTSSPMLLHRVHERRWDADGWVQNARYFQKQIQRERGRSIPDAPPDSVYRLDVETDGPEAVSHRVHDWLRARADATWLRSDPEVTCDATVFRSMRDFHAVYGPEEIRRLSHRNNVLEERVETARNDLKRQKQENKKLLSAEKSVRAEVARTLSLIDHRGTRQGLQRHAAVWLTQNSRRTRLALAVLLCLGAGLFVVPIVASMPGSERLVYWMAAVVCWAGAGAALLVRYVLRQESSALRGLEEVRRHLVDIEKRLSNRA